MIFWVVSIALFAWGLAYAGLVVFSFGIATPEHWSGLVEQGRIRAEYAQFILDIPRWVVVITAMAAITRFFGGVALLLHSARAVPLYAASLLLMVIIMFRGFVLADVASVIRPSQMVLEAAFLALSFFALWWAHYQVSAGRLL